MGLTAFQGRCPTCGYDHSAPIDLARIHEKMLSDRAAEATKHCREQITESERQDSLSCTDDVQATKPISHQITSGGDIPEWTDEDKERLGVALEQMKQMRVTKPQEPVGKIERCRGGYFDGAIIPCAPFDHIVWTNGKMPTLGTKLYTTPQPCPKCREWENKYLMEQAVNAGDGVLLSENERLKAKCAELEAERDALKASMDGWRSCAHQSQSECDALKDDRDTWKARTEFSFTQRDGLKQERDVLAITVQQMREALESLSHVEYALDLPLLQLRAIEALTLPAAFEIIKRHDAEVLRKAAASAINLTCECNPAAYIRHMASELEESCQP